MKPTTILLLAVLLAGTVSAAVTALFSVQAAPPVETRALAPDAVASLARTIAGLQEEQVRLASAIDELHAQLSSASPGSERIPQGEIDAAVRRYLEGREAPQGPAIAAPADASFDKQAIFDRLLAGDVDDGEAQRLWSELAEQGASEELLSLFEERVAGDPNDPDKRVDLGVAYLQRIQEVGNGPLAGVYATQADEAFDAALEIDDHHWDARFHKAVALSFWPPVFGKQGAAIHEFEILARQQAGMTPTDGHAQTHLLLGNMYQQIGESQKALAAWQQGAALFPGFQPIQDQLLLHGGQ